MLRPFFGFVLFIVWAARLVAQEPAMEPARFHHVLLNVTDPPQTIEFYSRVFGAVPVKFRGVSDALFTERSFILLNHVDRPPDSRINTGIWHIGWGGVDVKSEYEWWKRHDVTFHTPLTPLRGSDNYYMYLSGPDKELIEINTMGHHRFAHVHFFCTDVNETVAWYARHLGLKPRFERREKPKDMVAARGVWANFLRCDNVLMIFYGKPEMTPAPPWWPDPPLVEIQPTKGRPIDRLGFSYRKIEPVFERMKAGGAKIVEPVTEKKQFGMRSFLVEGPDRVTIEIVEAKPIPEGVWE